MRRNTKEDGQYWLGSCPLLGLVQRPEGQQHGIWNADCFPRREDPASKLTTTAAERTFPLVATFLKLFFSSVKIVSIKLGAFPNLARSSHLSFVPSPSCRGR